MASFRDFLFSKANRNFLVFLFFFAVAGIFWMLTTLNETYEQEIRVPISYADVPKTVVMTSAETDTVRVTVQDKGITLLSYLYGDLLRNISVDFKQHARQNGTGEVPAAELTKKVASRLAASTKLVSIKPEHLLFYYNYGEKKRVPVKWRGTVTPEELYYISEVETVPDSVTVYASHEKLDSIDAVYTEVLNQTDFNDTLTVDSRLQKLAGVKMMPDAVTLRFLTDVLTEESFDNIPVRSVNVPDGKILRTFPAKVSVKFVTGLKTFPTLSRDEFVVVADYNDIRSNPTPRCSLRLLSVPDGVSRAVISGTGQVDYLIEEQMPGRSHTTTLQP